MTEINKLDEYQDATEQTALGYASSDESGDKMETIIFLSLALNGEAGEIAEKAKKYKREDDDSYLEELKDELGDELWYLARLADELDVSLSEVATRNVDKLLDREERDMITGDGDNR